MASVSEILVVNNLSPPSDARELSKRADTIIERGINREVYTPLYELFDSDLVTKKIFPNVIKIISSLWLKFFLFQMSGRWFRGTPKGVHTPINPEGFQTYWPQLVVG